MPVKIEVSNDGVTWCPDPGPGEVWRWSFARTDPRAEAREIKVRYPRTRAPVDRSDWPFGRMAAIFSEDALWSSSTGPDGGWSLVRSNEDVHAWIQIRPKGETWNGSAWVSESAHPKPSPRIVRQHSDDEKTWTTCDCHETDPMRITYTVNIAAPWVSNGAFGRLIADELRRASWSAAAAIAPQSFGLSDLVRNPPRWNHDVRMRPIDTWAPKVSPIAETLCGCGKHKIDPDGDRYAQHNAWSCGWTNGRDHSPEGRWPTDNATHVARGIGISAPVPEPLAVQDPTGDDVARDAPTALDYLRRR